MVGNERKLKKNVGDFPREAPTVGQSSAVLMVERLLKGVLDVGVAKLLASRDDAVRYFSHFFDTTVGVKERDQFVDYFFTSPPKTVLGFTRAGAEMPCFAIVLMDEEESEAFLGDLADGDDRYEYTGAFFSASYAIYVHTTHATMTQVLYQLAKAIVHASKGVLLQAGALGVRLSGGELQPDERYMPENWFTRVLRVSVEHPYVAPNFLPVDPSKLRTMIFAHDVVVDGVRGGVTVGDNLSEPDDA